MTSVAGIPGEMSGGFLLYISYMGKCRNAYVGVVRATYCVRGHRLFFMWRD